MSFSPFYLTGKQVKDEKNDEPDGKHFQGHISDFKHLGNLDENLTFFILLNSTKGWKSFGYIFYWNIIKGMIDSLFSRKAILSFDGINKYFLLCLTSIINWNLFQQKM